MCFKVMFLVEAINKYPIKLNREKLWVNHWRATTWIDFPRHFPRQSVRKVQRGWRSGNASRRSQQETGVDCPCALGQLLERWHGHFTFVYTVLFNSCRLSDFVYKRRGRYCLYTLFLPSLFLCLSQRVTGVAVFLTRRRPIAGKSRGKRMAAVGILAATG